MDPSSYVVAKFPFQTEDKNAISFLTQQLILVHERTEGEWWLGEKVEEKEKGKEKGEGKRGFFPHSHVSSLPGVVEEWQVAVGKVNFNQNEAEVPKERLNELLNITMGEMFVLFHPSQKQEWWVGCGRGRVGYLSRDMVEVIKEETTKKRVLESLFPRPKPIVGDIILKVHIGNNQSKAMKFDQSLTVAEILLLIQKKLKLPSSIPASDYALFLCPPLSMWCPEAIPLCLFDLKPFSEVEFLRSSKRDELITGFETRNAPLYVRVICACEADKGSKTHLSVQKGEILQVVDIVNDEWWECRRKKWEGRRKRRWTRDLTDKVSIEKKEKKQVEDTTKDETTTNVAEEFTFSDDDNEDNNHDPANKDEGDDSVAPVNDNNKDNSKDNIKDNNKDNNKDNHKNTSLSTEQGFVPSRYLALLVMDAPSSPTHSNAPRELPTTVLCSSPDLLPITIRRIQKDDPKLRGLSLTRCCVNREWLEKLTSALSTNTNINTLDLSHNGVQSPEMALPPLFKSVQKNLRKLIVSHCSLIGVPSEVIVLGNLKELYLNNNNLTGLPSSIGLLTNLEKLDMSFNKLEGVPEQLHLLKSLVDLNMSHNKLTDLPSFLLSLKKLKSISVAKNPLKGFPKEVVERGNEDLINFMSNMLGGKRSMYRMKLMIVGQENVGKTSLMRALKKKSEKRSKIQKLKEKEDQPNVATDGIDIQEWHVKTNLLSSEERVEFSSWDFAGQEVYYSTHHLFLSRRAVYIIVYNVFDFASAKVDYWVKSVLLRAPKAPMMFVATHIDERGAEERFENSAVYLQRKYSKTTNIVAIHACSPRTGANISELRQVLVETALKQPYMPEEVPLRYCDLQSKILSLRQVGKFPTISWDTFCEMAEDSEIKEESFSSVATYLNDLGAISYFPEVDPEVVIIDPQWITKMFATIVTTGGQAQFVKNGLLRATDFHQLWKAHPRELHSYMLSLLEKFEVVHRINEDEEQGNAFVTELGVEGEGSPSIIPSSPSPSRSISPPPFFSPSSPPVDSPFSSSLPSSFSSSFTSPPVNIPAATPSPLLFPASPPSLPSYPQTPPNYTLPPPSPSGSPLLSHLKTPLPVASHPPSSSPPSPPSIPSSPSLVSSSSFSSLPIPTEPSSPTLSQTRPPSPPFSSSPPTSSSSPSLLHAALSPPSSPSSNSTNSIFSSTVPPPSSPPSSLFTSTVPQPSLSSTSPSSPPPAPPSSCSPIPSPAPSTSLPSLFVPCLLAVDPDSSLLAQHWPPYNSEETVFGRVYKFDFLFRGFFPLLTVRFLRSKNWTTSFYWRTGIILRDKRPEKKDIRARMTLTDELQLTLYLRGKGDSLEQLRSILTLTNELISEWLKKRAEVFVPCMKCLRGGGRKVVLLPLADCESAAAANRPFVVCPGGNHTAEVKDIAPDITLVGVNIPQINYSQLTMGEEIGKGGWGVVYRATYEGEALWSGQNENEGVYEVAFKRFQNLALEGLNEKDKKYRAAMYLEFQHEVRVSGSLKHTHLVRLLGVVTSPIFGTVMEFMEEGDLFSYLEKNGKLTWGSRLQLALDVAEGMKFLHSLKLMHRDLKSPNILLTRQLGRLSAKVADFGLTRDLEVAVEKGKVEEGGEGGGGGIQGQGGVTNPTWLAPEVLMGQRSTLKIDVYSFGVVLWELLTSQQYFGNCTFSYQIEDNVKNGLRPEVPIVDEVVVPYVDLLQECWAQDAWNRPSFAQISKRLKITLIEAEHSPNFDLFEQPTSPFPSSSSPHFSPPSPSPLSSRSSPLQKKEQETPLSSSASHHVPFTSPPSLSPSSPISSSSSLSPFPSPPPSSSPSPSASASPSPFSPSPSLSSTSSSPSPSPSPSFPFPSSPPISTLSPPITSPSSSIPHSLSVGSCPSLSEEREREGDREEEGEGEGEGEGDCEDEGELWDKEIEKEKDKDKDKEKKKDKRSKGMRTRTVLKALQERKTVGGKDGRKEGKEKGKKLFNISETYGGDRERERMGGREKTGEEKDKDIQSPPKKPWRERGGMKERGEGERERGEGGEERGFDRGRVIGANRAKGGSAITPRSTGGTEGKGEKPCAGSGGFSFPLSSSVPPPPSGLSSSDLPPPILRDVSELSSNLPPPLTLPSSPLKQPLPSQLPQPHHPVSLLSPRSTAPAHPPPSLPPQQPQPLVASPTKEPQPQLESQQSPLQLPLSSISPRAQLPPPSPRPPPPQPISPNRGRLPPPSPSPSTQQQTHIPHSFSPPPSRPHAPTTFSALASPSFPPPSFVPPSPSPPMLSSSPASDPVLPPTPPLSPTQTTLEQEL